MKQTKKQLKKSLFILGIIASLAIQFAGSCLYGAHLILFSRICTGIGCVLFPLCINRLYRLSYEKEFPDLVHQEEIELHDERNVQIRNHAKARASDIIRWVIIGVAWLNFLAGGSLWISLALIATFALLYLLEWHYTVKYQKEM